MVFFALYMPTTENEVGNVHHDTSVLFSRSAESRLGVCYRHCRAASPPPFICIGHQLCSELHQIIDQIRRQQMQKKISPMKNFNVIVSQNQLGHYTQLQMLSGQVTESVNPASEKVFTFFYLQNMEILKTLMVLMNKEFHYFYIYI